MSSNHELLLSEERQLELTTRIHRESLFGIKENPADFITLKSGRKSPHYLDMRKGISRFAIREAVSMSMHDLARAKVQKLGHDGLSAVYDYLAGTPEAFTSYVPRIADEAKMGVLQPRVANEKTRGNKAPILGAYQLDQHVAAFDDVITDGESKIDAIRGFDAGGLKVVDYFVVVDREEGGSAQVVEATGIEIESALVASKMAIMLFSENEINQTQFDNVHEYLELHGDMPAKLAMRAAA